MYMLRSRSTLPCLALLGLLFVGGCSRVTTANASGITEIKFWNGFTGPDGKTMERMVRQFQKENPDVRVRMQIIPWAQYYGKLTLGLAFHEGPDVFVCHGNHLAEFARYGVFKPLETLQRGTAGLPAADFLPKPWEAAHYCGVLYGIPLDCHPLGLYFNR